MANAAVKSAGRKFPVAVLEGLRPFDKRNVGPEVLAGLTLAALAIPEVMGYANIAGMPVITGLYTLVLPLMIFAIFGSSRHLVVGADSATAAVMFAGLTGLATAGSPQYIALAGLLALMAGCLMILARVLRLGFIANFLSRTVLIGFLTGVGIQVALGQFDGMLGISGISGKTIPKFVDTMKALDETSMTTLAVSVGVIATILIFKKVSPRIPGALVAVVGAILVSKAADLAAHGVSTLGKVPSGLPGLTFPSGLKWTDITDLFPTAVSVFVVILAQSAATSRAYAAKYDDAFDENTDLVGIGLAETAACFTGTFVVNGSPTKTQMVDSAGGRTQLAQLAAGAIVVIVLLFLTVPLQYMPNGGPGVDRLPHRLAADRHRRDAQGPRGATRRVRRRGDHRADRRGHRRQGGDRPGDRAVDHRPPAQVVPATQHGGGAGVEPPVAPRPDDADRADCARSGRVPVQRRPVLRERERPPGGHPGHRRQRR